MMKKLSFWEKSSIFTYSIAQTERSRPIVSIFVPEGIMMCLSNFQYYFEISRPVEISTRPNFGEPTNKNVEKIQNFKMS